MRISLFMKKKLTFIIIDLKGYPLSDTCNIDLCEVDFST